MDKELRQAADKLVGIVTAFAYPESFTTPTRAECEAALDAYNDAQQAAFDRVVPRDHECKPRLSPGLKTRR